MKRSDFIKGFIGTIAITALPSTSKSNEITEVEYSFDELFEQPYPNANLFYPKKDSALYLEIRDRIGINRILDCKHFTCYLGYNDNIIPIKEKYSISDFTPFVLATKSHYKRNDCFSETERGVFFRMIKETPETMHFDVFLGDFRGQFHS